MFHSQPKQQEPQKKILHEYDTKKSYLISSYLVGQICHLQIQRFPIQDYRLLILPASIAAWASPTPSKHTAASATSPHVDWGTMIRELSLASFRLSTCSFRTIASCCPAAIAASASSTGIGFTAEGMSAPAANNS